MRKSLELIIFNSTEMGYYSEHPRVKRLNEVYNESGYNSVNAFAKSVNAISRTVSNYIKGDRVPNDEFVRLVIERFPIYNYMWLMDGIGSKYNEDRVSVDPEGNADDKQSQLFEKFESFYKQLADSLQKQIDSLTMVCKSQQEQIQMLKDCIEMEKRK